MRQYNPKGKSGSEKDMAGYGGDVEHRLLAAALEVSIIHVAMNSCDMIRDTARPFTVYPGHPDKRSVDVELVTAVQLKRMLPDMGPVIFITDAIGHPDGGHFDVLLPADVLPPASSRPCRETHEPSRLDPAVSTGTGQFVGGPRVTRASKRKLEGSMTAIDLT